MSSPNRTDRLRPAELRRQMSEHLLYEIEQCASALIGLAADERNDERDFAPLTIEFGRGNAVLEGFLLHVRVLEDFFNRRSRKSDIVAIDFIASQQSWERVIEECPSPPTSARDRTNRGIAHLSWDRVHERRIPGYDASKKLQSWEPYKIWDVMKPRIRLFIQLADPSGLGDQFAQRAEAALCAI